MSAFVGAFFVGRIRAAAVVFGLVVGLVASLAPGVPVLAAPVVSAVAVSAEEPGQVSVPVSPVSPRSGSSVVMPQARPAAPVWPVGGWGVVSAPSSASVVSAVEPVSVGGLPVAVVVPSPVSGDAALGDVPVVPAESAVVSSVRVTVADQALAARAGVRGVLVSLARADGVGLPGRTGLELGYSPFRYAFGGGFGSRLMLVSLPSCVLSTPETPQCRVQAPVPDVVNRFDDAVVAASWLEVAGDGDDGVVYAMTAGTVSGEGDFRATSLSPSSSWSAGSQGGDFSYGYPFAVPPAPGGLVPEVRLGYASGSVDGRTHSTNNQPSVAGEGWELPVSYVERSFNSCVEDGQTYGDLCYKDGTDLRLVLGGRSSRLVLDAAGQRWRLEHDEGWQVFFHVDNHFEVDAPDGTRYLFGYRAETPGWVTQSRANVPVFCDDPGEPCYSSSGLRWSWQYVTYRWHLDHVVDPRGNTMTYYYWRDQQNYGLHGGAEIRPYDLATHLDRVEYGGNVTAGTPATARVRLEYAARCWVANLGPYPAECYGSANWYKWPDTPWDQYCDLAATSCPGRTSPTFFTRNRLYAVATEVATGTGGWAPVDRWDLQHQFPDPGDGTAAALWLLEITHTGLVDGSLIDYPRLFFAGVAMTNRVETSPPLKKYRLSLIVHGGTGRETHVVYYGADCSASSYPVATAHDNPRRCFPQWFAPPGGAPGWGWFHKYPVARVTERDLTGLAPDQLWVYEYNVGGSTTPVLWAHDDNQNVSAARQSWSQWRGYTDVITTHGTVAGQQTVTADRYTRGMHGDRATPSGGIRYVTVTDSEGGVTDFGALQGRLREHTVLASRNPFTWHTTTIHHHSLTATAARDMPWDFGDRTAWLVRETKTRHKTWLAHLGGGTGGWRTTETEVWHDTAGPLFTGLPYYVQARGDTATTADDVCTQTWYAQNQPAWMLNYPYLSLSDDCAGGGYLAGGQTYYDNGALGAAPSWPYGGLATKTEQLNTGGVWQQAARASYDPHGRVLDGFDGLNRRTTTRYTPATGGPVTQVEQTNPAGHATTTTLSRERGQPATIVDANGKTTRLVYDPLGRLTGVLLHRSGPGANTFPDITYTYHFGGEGGSPTTSVTTKRLGPAGQQIATVELFDGLMRPRQTQSTAPDGMRVIVDTAYDARGLTARSTRFYNNASGPTDVLATFTQSQAETATSYGYDSLGRQTTAIQLAAGTEKWRSTFSYDGDRVEVTPPTGGTRTTTITDAHGRTVALRQYFAEVGIGDPTYQTTAYTYDRLGRLTRVTDPAGNRWDYGYDLRGRKTSSTDPDAGTTAMTYDLAGQLRTTLNARGITLAHDYDAVGRRTSTWTGAVGTGTKLTEAVYDTIAKGQPTSSTRFAAGQAYKSEVLSYDDRYRPLSTKVTIPAGETGLAGSYTFATTHNVDGSIATQTLPGLGGLAAETLTHGYSAAGLPTSLTGADGYLTSTSHHWDGQVYQQIRGPAGKQVRHTHTVEAGTRRLTRTQVDTEHLADPGTWVDQTTTEYGYDPAGNIKAIAGKTAGLRDQVECFSYDLLRRLIQAWTEAAWSCATPQRTGVDPYWLTWTYDAIGNRRTQVDHAVGGNITTTYTPGSGKPHTLATMSTTGPSGTTTVGYAYDNTGNTRTRPGASGQQTLDWHDDTGLARITEGGQTTEYLYHADGNRLIRRDPTGKTLYLPGGTELRYTTAGGQTTATRYYGHGGSVIAVRTSSSLTRLSGDHHGTATLAIDAANLSVQRRRSKPFGEPRGTQPAGWPGDKGFVGGTNDPTGLTHLGAREYDPTTGRFISVDPIQDLTDPQQWHGYTYANNNPTTWSDPSGLRIDDSGPACGDPGGAPCNGTLMYGSPVSIKYDARKKPASVKINGIEVTTAEVTDPLAYAGRVDEWNTKANATDPVARRLQAMLMACDSGESICEAHFRAALNAELAAYLRTQDPNCGEVCQQIAQVMAANFGLAYMGAGVGALRGSGRGTFRPNSRNTCPNSFDAETPVLMADGTTKAIKDVKIGDQVLATDPATGETAAKTITALHINHDTDLTDLTITDNHGRTQVINTTQHHPFWSPKDRRWTDATDLQPGDPLLSPDGSTVTVAKVRSYRSHRPMYNLTVDQLHTYYVMAGTTPVLVHNTGPGVGGCGPGIANDLGGLPLGKQSHVRTVGSESELQGLYGKWSQGGTDITPTGYNGTMVRLPDGTIVGYRNASRSGGATIDIKLPDGSNMKVHIDGT